MRRRHLAAVLLALGALLALPGVASADSLEASGNGALPDSVAINTLWVIVAGCLVMFMQAGFMFLEIGFSRGKNAGTVVAKILVNFSIAALAFYACGFAFAFGANGSIGPFHDVIGNTGFFLQDYGNPTTAFPVMGLSNATVESKWFFQFVFCAVSLAIVWGTTLERIKFGVYVIYAIVFAALIYPIGAHWVFGGGWLQAQHRHAGLRRLDGGPPDRRHRAAWPPCCCSAPAGASTGRDGKPRAIPGHSMPLFGLGVLILWLGWFGFNPGSTLGALDGRFAEVLVVTQLGGRRRRARRGDHQPDHAEDDRHRHGRQRRDRGPGRDHRSVRLRRDLGGADHRRRRRRDRRLRRAGDRQAASTTRSVPSRRTAWPASGARSSCGLFTAPAAGRVQRVRRPRGRAVCTAGSFTPARRPGARASSVAFAFVFAVCFATFWRHQEDLRAARHRGAGGCGARHLRARHVRLPGAVHPAARSTRRWRELAPGPGVPARRRPPSADGQRRPRRRGR